MTNVDNRNILAWGEENQNKLAKLRVAVIGSGNLAQIITASLAGLGVGYEDLGGAIIAMDNKRLSKRENNILAKCTLFNEGAEKVYSFKDRIEMIKSRCNYTPIFSYFSHAMLMQHNPQMIIDATNDPNSKELAADYCKFERIPMISASNNRFKGAITTYFPTNDRNKKSPFKKRDNFDFKNLFHGMYTDDKQFSNTSSVISGLVLEELRKYLFKYDNEEEVCFDNNFENLKTFHYNPFNNLKVGFVDSFNSSNVTYLGDKKALVVGAGALGNFVALGLADCGVGKIDIVDFDKIEEHNLNRQIMLYGKTGEFKATTLAERIMEFNPRINATAIKGKIGKIEQCDDTWLTKLYEIESERLRSIGGEDHIAKNKKDFIDKIYSLSGEDRQSGIKLINTEDILNEGYNIILGCVDNKFARVWANEKAVQIGTAYIDGGTGPKEGQLAVYSPNRYSCVQCQINLMRFPAKYGCAQGPAASVVMSNSIIGGMMVSEASKILTGQIEKRNSLEIHYDTQRENRIDVARDRRGKNGHCK